MSTCIAFFIFDDAEELDWVGPWEVLAAWGQGACSAGSAMGLPAPVLPQSETEQRAVEAAAFAEQHIEAWPDVDAFVADYADDYTFADPTWSDFRVGYDNVITMLRLWKSMTD